MQVIDINSDFVLLDRAPAGMPFHITYHAEDRFLSKVVATFDGETYQGCTRFNEDLIAVPITGGDIDDGRLVASRVFLHENFMFKDDKRLDHRYTESLDVRLGRSSSVTPSVVFAFERDLARAAEMLQLQPPMMAEPQQEATTEEKELLHTLTLRVEMLGEHVQENREGEDNTHRIA